MAYREVTYRKPMCEALMGIAEAWHQDKYICHNDYTASDSFTVTVEQHMPKVHSLRPACLIGKEGAFEA